ncbi:hypothetical protein SDC9_82018 [bioreactor metagenome]|uniref:Uncharacterized protein n=1 Tax=bioreactor metagenome TaxID=1076179 RepID=A0A644Z3J8_9ZZZZ
MLPDLNRALAGQNVGISIGHPSVAHNPPNVVPTQNIVADRLNENTKIRLAERFVKVNLRNRRDVAAMISVGHIRI